MTALSSCRVLIAGLFLVTPDASPAEPTPWAFGPRNPGTPPSVKDETWPSDFVDRYVLARLETAGIAPSPEADRATLIRRLALDLTGLPPTPADVERFVRDLSVSAYERIVDQYLNSPQFAEQWARHWLDQAQYADAGTNWRWRDWVIDAIGRDVPFDRFTIEQIAGDLLPDATKEQRLATAFLLQPPSNRKGADATEEERMDRVIASTNKATKVWLGLDLACARCHQHPSGGLESSDFYGLFAFFNNADEEEIAIGKTFNDERQLYPLEQAYARAREAVRPDFEQWLLAVRAKVTAAADDPVVYHAIDREKLALHSETGNDLEILEDGSVRAGGALVGTDLYTLRFPAPAAEITGFRIETLADPSLPNDGPGSPPDGNFVLSEFRAFVQPDAGKPPRGQPFLRAAADFSQTDFEIAKAIDGNPATGWAIAPEMGKPHHADFVLAQPLANAAELPVILNFVQEFGPGKGHLLARFRVLVRSGGKNEVDLPERILALIALEKRKRAEESTLFEYFVSKIHPETMSLLADLEAKRAADAVTVRVLHERDETRRATYRYLRGDLLQPDQDAGEITPHTPTFLPALKTEGSASRLDLARWIVAPENPLTARVAVNEIWRHLFGRGLAATAEDFGPGGNPPTHPELLDALAEAFVRQGWSRKQLIRSIVLSSTYRQDSTARPEPQVLDPANLLLHRQNRIPLEPGVVRDSQLAVSGLLATATGGPSEGNYRRSLYHLANPIAINSAHCPALPPIPQEIAASAGNDTAEQAAAALTRLVLTRKGVITATERITDTFQRAFSRDPDAAELQERTDFLQSKRTHYLEHLESMREVIAKSPPPDGIAPEDYAAWIATIHDLMNATEFQTRK